MIGFFRADKFFLSPSVLCFYRREMCSFCHALARQHGRKGRLFFCYEGFFLHLLLKELFLQASLSSQGHSCFMAKQGQKCPMAKKGENSCENQAEEKWQPRWRRCFSIPKRKPNALPLDQEKFTVALSSYLVHLKLQDDAVDTPNCLRRLQGYSKT